VNFPSFQGEIVIMNRRAFPHPPIPPTGTPKASGSSGFWEHMCAGGDSCSDASWLHSPSLCPSHLPILPLSAQAELQGLLPFWHGDGSPFPFFI
jgi:hypothetical protein